MTRIIFKILLTAVIVTAVSELAKRLTWMGAILAALPLTSILALIWLYSDTQDVKRVSDLSTGIFWAVLPSLLFFLVLPLLLKNGFKFVTAMGMSCVLMVMSYTVYIWMIKKLGVY